jgi:hypothetical protein
VDSAGSGTPGSIEISVRVTAEDPR